MKKLNMFIGPPDDVRTDAKAVSRFLKEEGEKIILGGTAVRVFERVLGTIAAVRLETACDGIPPFGSVAGITALEGSCTLRKYNEVFNRSYPYTNAVSILKDKIASAGSVKIYHGCNLNPVNGIDKRKAINDFVNNLRLSGMVPEIVHFQEM